MISRPRHTQSWYGQRWHTQPWHTQPWHTQHRRFQPWYSQPWHSQPWHSQSLRLFRRPERTVFSQPCGGVVRFLLRPVSPSAFAKP